MSRAPASTFPPMAMPGRTDTGTATAAEVTPAELRDFRRLAGIMVPADAHYGVPGADDPAIFADIARTLGRDAADVRAVLAGLAGEGFGELDDADAEAMAMRMLATGGRAVLALGRVVLAAYYRDDRVVRSLGREPRPPFPRGYELPDGDWSLLKAVEGRPRLWRDDRKG